MGTPERFPKQSAGLPEQNRSIEELSARKTRFIVELGDRDDTENIITKYETN